MQRSSAVLALLAVACGGNSPNPQPPAAPANLAAAGGAGQIALTWTAVDGATGYQVLRGGSAGAEASLASTASASYTDTGLAAGATWFYVVKATSSTGTSAASNEASATTAPPAPAGLTASTTDTAARLQWTAAAGATSYTVLRAPGGSSSFAQVGTVSAAAFSDSGLTPNTAYQYEVHASNAAGTSPDATVSATTAPVAPAGVAVASTSNHHVDLGWTAAPGAGSAGYHVLRATAPGGPYASAGTTTGTHFTDTMLANDTTYFYVVHTVGGSGESGDSNEATGTPFIEICAVDAASYAVSVFDGAAGGNVAPKRSFGWSTGIVEGTGIGADATNVYVASRYTQTVNVYPIATFDGDHAPSATLSLPGQPTALTVAGGEILVGIGNQVVVYDAAATGSATPKRTLTLPAGAAIRSGITGIQVFSGTTGATAVNETFVLADNQILRYANSVGGSTAPIATITVAGTTSTTRLAGPAYDNSSDDAIFVGWTDTAASTAKVASFSRTDGSLKEGPIVADGTTNPTFDEARIGGVAMDGTNIWVTVSGRQSIGAVLRYPHTGTGGEQPTAGWTGSNTKLYQPGALVLDGSGELWFVNGKNGATGYLKTTTSGNRAPTNALLGDATGLYDPAAIGADRPRGEIVVLNRGPAHAISAYPAALSGTTPARQLAGSTTTLATMLPAALAMDEGNQEYWVDDLSSNNGFTAFDGSLDGNQAPLREIERDIGLGTFQSMYWDPIASQIFAVSIVGGGFNLDGWNRTDAGSVPPDRAATLASTVANNPVVDQVDGLLFVQTDFTTLDAFAAGFSGGALAPTLSYDTSAVAGALSAVDAEGSELYYVFGGSIVVASKPASGALTVSRTIAGDKTGLYAVGGLTICN